MFGAVEDGQEVAVRFFEAWKAEVGFLLHFLKNNAMWKVFVQVIKEVPADRLLVWQVKQGWEPLCQVKCHHPTVEFKI